MWPFSSKPPKPDTSTKLDDVPAPSRRGRMHISDRLLERLSEGGPSRPLPRAFTGSFDDVRDAGVHVPQPAPPDPMFIPQSQRLPSDLDNVFTVGRLRGR